MFITATSSFSQMRTRSPSGNSWSRQAILMIRVPTVNCPKKLSLLYFSRISPSPFLWFILSVKISEGFLMGSL